MVGLAGIEPATSALSVQFGTQMVPLRDHRKRRMNCQVGVARVLDYSERFPSVSVARGPYVARAAAADVKRSSVAAIPSTLVYASCLQRLPLV